MLTTNVRASGHMYRVEGGSGSKQAGQQSEFQIHQAKTVPLPSGVARRRENKASMEASAASGAAVASMKRAVWAGRLGG